MGHSQINIVTNNPMVKELGYPMIEVQGNIVQVMKKVLDMALQGYRLLSHPLSGSVKPSINPYKSIIVSRAPDCIDYREVEIVQTCLEKVIDMRKQSNYFTWGETVEADLRFLDCELIKSGIQSLTNVN